MIGPNDSQMLGEPAVIQPIRQWLKHTIGNGYALAAPVLVALAFFAYTLARVFLLIRRTNIMAWLIVTALLGAVVARIRLLAIVDSMLFPAITMAYLAPAYPLLIAFATLGFCLLIPIMNRYRGNRL